MKSFREFLLQEGGNAIKTSVRIKQEYVESTLKEIYKQVLPLLKIKETVVASLGSTGKKLPGGSSGDIDLAVYFPNMIKNNKDIETMDDVFDRFIFVAKKLGTDYKDMRQMGLVSIGFPIYDEKGNNTGEVVQLDFMPTDNLEYSQWAFYSPAEWESQYKGLYRNEILYAIAKYMDFKVLKKVMNDVGEEVPVEWERFFFDLSKGLLKGRQSIEGKKGLLKSPKTLEKELYSKDIDKVVTMLFGPGVKPNQVLTFNDAWNLIHSPNFPYKSKLKDIINMAKEGILSKGQPLPKEME